jgi:hypothetical protein
MKVIKKYSFVLIGVLIFCSCGVKNRINRPDNEIYLIVNAFLETADPKKTIRLHKFSNNYDVEKNNWSHYLTTNMVRCNVRYEVYSKIHQDYLEAINHPDLTVEELKIIEKKYKEKMAVKIDSLLTKEDILYMKQQNNDKILEWDKKKLQANVQFTNHPNEGFTLSNPYFSKDTTKAILFRSSKNEDNAFFFIKKENVWSYFCRFDIRIVFVD